MEPDSSRSIVRFGEFEFDPAAGDLRRLGHRLTIQEQPLKLLEMLVARAGQVVTRQELCHGLWPDAFVDFDNGLNNAVSRLRTALGDSATSPRFVETMGRRGYRFIGAIQLGREAADPSPVRAWLIGPGERVALKAGENVLGRHAPDVVELQSPTVSRRHARITVGDETLIEDLESKNGTFVEERRVSRAIRLTDGAHVRIGSLTLRFTVVSDGDETRTDADE
jgi:DNA-binding winged helix-turn-helix (wHTH) protein